MIDNRLVEAFAAVLEEGGFERAAERLRITQSAVSQRIRALEDGMGRILIVRETPPRATEAGERLMRHYRNVAGLEAELGEELGAPPESGFRRLTIAVNADSLSIWLLEALSPFLSESRVTLELLVDDQEKTIRFLRAGTAAGCVSSQKVDLQGFARAEIGALRYVLVAAPKFARRWFKAGFGREAAERAPIIHFNRDDGLQAQALRQVFGSPPPEPPAHYIPSSERMADAVLRGLGYAMMPEAQAAPELRRRRLVELDPRGRVQTPLYWYRWNRPTELLERVSGIILSEGGRLLGSATPR